MRRRPGGHGTVTIWRPAEIIAAKSFRETTHGTLIRAGSRAIISKPDYKTAMLRDAVRETIVPPRIKSRDRKHNLVVDEGVNYLLDAGVSGATQITSWFVLFVDQSPTVAAGDTLASHAGWTEFTEYTGNRPAFTDGGVSGKSLDNSASPASITANSSSNDGLGGIAICSVNTGTAGTLLAVVALDGGNRTILDTETADATYTLTGADDGV